MNDKTQPHIGQIVDYYQDDSTRLAALVVQSHPSEVDSRPLVNLQVFQPDGKIIFMEEIKPVDPDSLNEANPDQIELEGRWGFAHEFAILQDLEDEVAFGTKTNDHVGTIQTDIL